MARTALLICDKLEGPALHLTKILDLFEIPWQKLVPGALDKALPAAVDRPYSVLCAMPLMSRVLGEDSSSVGPPRVIEEAESVFLYGADRSPATHELLRRVTQSASVVLLEAQGKERVCTVSDKWPEVCGPLSGQKVPATLRKSELAIADPSGLGIDSFISTSEGCVFGAVNLNGTPWYLVSCAEVIDVGRPVEKKGYFDVADHFLSAAPIVMYLRHSFTDVMSALPECGACLIVDDLVLRSNYGFVNFERLSAFASDHNFGFSVGFIPWNCERSQSSVVNLFKRHADRLSISIHGCDHTALEFGGKSSGFMNDQAKLAHARMEKHRRRTGLGHDALMIFPQGAFSTVAPMVLKHNGFMAAVNTEVSPTDSPSATTIGDTWQTAIFRYADFPIFTRRNTFHGLHNFAFDLMLGKPCLIVTHHADFQDEGREVVEFIDRLNALNVPLKWRPLGDVIRRSYRRRFRNGVQHIKMFGNEIIVENAGGVPCRVLVERVEHNAQGVDSVESAGGQVAFACEDDVLRFELQLAPRSRALVRVGFKDVYGEASRKRPFTAQGQVALRRYLSEFRDESQARAPLVHKCAGMVRELLNGASRS